MLGRRGTLILMMLLPHPGGRDIVAPLQGRGRRGVGPEVGLRCGGPLRPRRNRSAAGCAGPATMGRVAGQGACTRSGRGGQATRSRHRRMGRWRGGRSRSGSRPGQGASRTRRRRRPRCRDRGGRSHRRALGCGRRRSGGSGRRGRTGLRGGRRRRSGRRCRRSRTVARDRRGRGRGTRSRSGRRWGCRADGGRLRGTGSWRRLGRGSFRNGARSRCRAVHQVLDLVDHRRIQTGQRTEFNVKTPTLNTVK